MEAFDWASFRGCRSMWRRVREWGPQVLALSGLGIGLLLGLKALSPSRGSPRIGWEVIAQGKPVIWGDPVFYVGLFLLYAFLLIRSIRCIE